mmetsp:Transcript_5991/g.10010  ORF Transcript_5991/g.10010 Transcript_5991/m.10010 type:complete len:310 (-) Transcript_5991:114-1043(-)|eukprot:CAMPEP_0119007352 /NCGR_PEP_ID=MMETSP1176-20130426/2956_1 /TAXON_ID=265551 /ORGANISM="Synedropsis recta cf, Strain CCMP1620" /LENGTH=309 /DNA_ID=CAMNT_0006959479 /DNA_START=85 /DNA_END=1014 /DNA_ORIENTATION=-
MYSSSKLVTALVFLASWASSMHSTTAFAPSLQAKNVMIGGAPTSFRRFEQNTFTQQSKRTASTSSISSSSLQMVATGMTFSAVAGALSGGLFAGSLHAIAGPDHLAALLPRCVGQRWYRASRIGALWGMGHGMSATLLGTVAFFCKNRISQMGSAPAILAKASSLTEVAVGISLVIIGLMGMKEAREWEHDMEGVQPQSLSAAAADPGVKTAQKRAVVFNGILHGFSWDGAPSLAPALAVATWSGNLTFLLAYALGTIGVMTIATTVIGEGTRRAGELFHRPDIPQKLSFYSSILAVVIGLVWCGLAIV